MSKLFAIYTLAGSDQRFAGQAYLSEKDLEAIEQSFAGEQPNAEYIITLTDGEGINVNTIDSIEEIDEDEE